MVKTPEESEASLAPKIHSPKRNTKPMPRIQLNNELEILIKTWRKSERKNSSPQEEVQLVEGEEASTCL